MIATLSKSQAELPKLVKLASQGEDVVITVEGKPKARLTSARTVMRPVELSPEQKEHWMRELDELRRSTSTGRQGITVEKILEEDRADRV